MIYILIHAFLYFSSLGRLDFCCDYVVYTDTRRKFSDAESFCQSQGQTLAFIKSNTDLNDFNNFMNGLAQSVNNDIFIGLRFDTSSSSFTWLDGEVLSLSTNWDQSIGEPNCHLQTCNGEYSHCVRITKDTYKFRTIECYRKYYTLCSKVDATTGLFTQTTGIKTSFLTKSTQPLTTSVTTTDNSVYSYGTSSNIYNPTSDVTTIQPKNRTHSYCNCYNCDTVNDLLETIMAGNLTFERIRQIVLDDFNKNIKPHISISKKGLSKTKRSKTSVPDHRWSSTSIGIVAVCVISVPVVLMVLIDLTNLCQHS